jgi:XRE family transcriptional regulator, regulator of sulfur utilization
MSDTDIDLGANIRALRAKRKLSLNELSRITGISASNLSSMELGKSSPTLSTLTKIAAAFGMKAGAFLDRVLYQRAVLCRKEASEDHRTHSGDFSVRALTSDVHGNSMESSIIDLVPAGRPLVLGDTGTERLLYCLQGEVSLKVDEEIYPLEEGDSVYLLPEAACEMSSRTSGPASLLLVTLTIRPRGI